MQKDFFKYQAQTTQFAAGFEVEKAVGSYIYGKDGRKYLDFVAGVSANTLGHSHPKIVEAIKTQAEKYLHVMVYGEYAQEMPVELCKLLATATPEPLEVTYLVNSGAEAIDGALKLAKRYTGREEIVSFHHSYHGNTHGALSVSGNEYHKREFRPLLPMVSFIGFNDEKDLEKITEKTACVLLETIQGAAGFLVPADDYLKKLKKRCEEVGALLILDEIQPGFGRTGKLFAFEHFGIVPDILVMGKGMGGGVPVGAFMSSREIMHALFLWIAQRHISFPFTKSCDLIEVQIVSCKDFAVIINAGILLEIDFFRIHVIRSFLGIDKVGRIFLIGNGGRSVEGCRIGVLILNNIYAIYGIFWVVYFHVSGKIDQSVC
jgi:acetylornithine/N-succinyldiaminopimelate aminotransferase